MSKGLYSGFITLLSPRLYFKFFSTLTTICYILVLFIESIKPKKISILACFITVFVTSAIIFEPDFSFHTFFTITRLYENWKLPVEPSRNFAKDNGYHLSVTMVN